MAILHGPWGWGQWVPRQWGLSGWLIKLQLVSYELEKEMSCCQACGWLLAFSLPAPGQRLKLIVLGPLVMLWVSAQAWKGQ